MKSLLIIILSLFLVAFAIWEWHRQTWLKESRIAALKDIQSTAAWASESISPLLQEGKDPEAIKKVMETQFANHHIVLSASLFSAEGNILATYIRPGVSIEFPRIHPLSVVPLEGKRLDMFYPITDGKKELGTLFIRIKTWEHVLVKGDNILAAPIVECDYKQ